VLNHAAALGLHSVIHWGANVSHTEAATAYVWLVMIIGPFAGLRMVAAGREPAGTLLVTACLAGGLAFSILTHFPAIGADHAGAPAPGAWERLFRSTVWYLAVAQAAGVAIGVGRVSALRARREPVTGTNGAATGTKEGAPTATDYEWLRQVNIDIGQAESAGTAAFFGGLLAPVFAFRRANGTIADRAAFLAAVAAGPARDTAIDSITFVGNDRAIVSCVVSMEVQGERRRFHNLRVFVKSDAGASWLLMAWANEPL
jgi:cbb3-type cytochrome oxidase subunit 3